MWGTKGERIEQLRGQGISTKDVERVRDRTHVGDQVVMRKVFEPDVQGRPYGSITTGTVVGKYPHLFVIHVSSGNVSYRWSELVASRRRQ